MTARRLTPPEAADKTYVWARSGPQLILMALILQTLMVVEEVA